MKNLISAVIAIMFVVVVFPVRSIAQTFHSTDERVAIELYNRTTK